MQNDLSSHQIYYIVQLNQEADPRCLTRPSSPRVDQPFFFLGNSPVPEMPLRSSETATASGFFCFGFLTSLLLRFCPLAITSSRCTRRDCGPGSLGTLNSRAPGFRPQRFTKEYSKIVFSTRQDPAFYFLGTFAHLVSRARFRTNSAAILFTCGAALESALQ